MIFVDTVDEVLAAALVNGDAAHATPSAPAPEAPATGPRTERTILN